MKAPHKIAQWAIVTALFAIGFFALLILAGEDDPRNPLSLGEWVAIKTAALAVIFACVLAGKYLNKRGFLPVMDEPLNEDNYE